MNKVVFLILFFAIEYIASVGAYAWYSRIAKNGGPKGYNTVNVMADCYGISIYCENPGLEKCSYDAMRSCPIGSQIFPMEQEAVNYARKQIEAGQKSGTKVMSSGKTVIWKVTKTSSEIRVKD